VQQINVLTEYARRVQERLSVQGQEGPLVLTPETLAAAPCKEWRLEAAPLRRLLEKYKLAFKL
jgi:hypothetical protein